MNCDDARARSVDANDEADAAAVAAHLEECEGCRAWQDDLRLVTARLDAWPPLESPAELPVPPEVAAAPRGTRRPALVGALVAVVLFAALAAVGAEVVVERGVVRVTLGRPAAPAAPDPTLALRAAFDEFDARQERRFEALAAAIDLQLADERAGSLARDRALLEGLGRRVVVASRPRRP